MAAGDMALNMLITATNQTGNVIGGLIGGFGSLINTFKLGALGVSRGFQVMGQDAKIGGMLITDGLKTAGGAVLGLAALVSAAAVGIGIALGIAGVKAASDFQTAMLSLVAHAGLAKSQIDNVSQSVLAMSVAVGRSPTQLAEALYPILSAFSGIQNQSAKSAIALDTLRMSFQTVAGTTTDGTKVANAAVGTFNALGLATNNVSENTRRMTGLFDIMDKTVQLGNMQWDAYKNVVSKLAVAIQGTNVTFKESQAALAEMTNEGFSAQRASTYLANTFNTLEIKTNTLAAHAKKLGIEFDLSKYGPMNLAQKIEYLNQITDGNKQKLLALMGNNSTALKTFNALSVGINGYKSNLDALNHSQGALKSSFDTASQGFNFQMSQMKATGEVILITIGQQILPYLSKLVAAVMPIIVQFSKWLVSSHAIANGIAFMVSAITTLVNIGSSVVNFFKNNQVAMDALLAVLAGVAAGVLVFAATAIPVLVAGFIAWAIAAGTAAIATLAAAWPFILIGIIVAAVVFGIIMAVQHWGAIAHWLQGVWAAVIGWLGGAIHSIGGFFVGVWDWIKTATGAAWAWIVNAVKVGAALLLAVVLAPILAIVGMFSWLYNHNYYFKDLIDTIVNVVKAGLAWIQGAWDKAISWLTGAWNKVKGVASSVWGGISSTVSSKSSEAGSWLQQAWTKAYSFLSDLWGKFVNLNVQTWDAVRTFFSGLWNNYIHPPLQSMWNSLLSFVNGWPAQAVQWGVNLIKGFINGIGSMLGAVGQTAQNIMGTVSKFLGFHSPAAEGEGRHIVVWGANMVAGFVSGMQSAQPLLNAQLNHMISAPGNLAYGGRQAGNAFALSGNGSSSGGQQSMHLTIQLDGKTITEAVGIRIAKEMRIQGAIRK